jgi:hypothetical protein
MIDQGLLPRHLQGPLEEALQASRVVNLIGPRQVGKTTLVRDILPGGHFATLDDATVLAALRADPMGQVELLVAQAGEGPVIIDEAQRAPEIALAIKKVVDGNRRKGQFLLTGSSNIFTTAAVTDTLAGRVMTLTLLPLSAAEINRADPGRMLDWAESGADVSKLPAIPKIARQGVLDLVARGGYPELRTLAQERTRTRAYRAYVDSIVDKDVAELLAVRKTDALRRLIDQLAARSSGELNHDALCTVVGINRKTLDTWLDALERLSIIRRLGSWASGETHREIRHPKLHLMDTGLLCALRNLSAVSFGPNANPPALGAVLETFVFGEVAKCLPHQNSAWDIYHWRDRHGREIDIIAVCPPAALVGIEVKSSASVGTDDFRHLRWFATEGPGRNRDMTGIVVYLGEEAVSFGPRMVALPLQTFWADWSLEAA